MPTVKIDCSASGDNEIVAAVPLRRIRVLAYTFVVQGAVTVKWRSATTALTGPMIFAASGGGISVPAGGDATGEGAVPLVVTAVNEALNLNLTGTVAVGGHVSYMLTP